jgi:ActR/RegA family two-component response regulator
MTAGLRRLLIVEDGHEYEEFVRLFLGTRFEVAVAHDAAEAARVAVEFAPEALLLDLRFERTPAAALEGDADDLATRRFGGDRARALRHLQDQQGTVVLAHLRERGCHVPALFIHDFPARRLDNLRQLYGDVHAIPSFDASAIAKVLGA